MRWTATLGPLGELQTRLEKERTGITMKIVDDNDHDGDDGDSDNDGCDDKVGEGAGRGYNLNIPFCGAQVFYWQKINMLLETGLQCLFCMTGYG